MTLGLVVRALSFRETFKRVRTPKFHVRKCAGRVKLFNMAAMLRVVFDDSCNGVLSSSGEFFTND